MPKKIARKRSTRKSQVKSVIPVSARIKEQFSQIKWGESYASLFLGVAVVVVAFVLIFSFLLTKSNNRKEIQTTSTNNKEEVIDLGMSKTYTVKQGDSLWTIAESLYGSGYNWVDIVNANKIENPNVLFVGSKLVIPSVKPRIVISQNKPAMEQNPITGNSYKIVKGDYLWQIAVRAYGDGYKWPEIAKANHLLNPDLIHSGNILILPR